MRIALWQTAGQPGDVAANLEVLDRTAAAAAGQGARLLIAPELYLSGYNIDTAVHRLAEPADGPACRAAAASAAKHGIALLFGYPERDGDDVYNSALLIERDGRALANYRKTHLYGPDEKRLYRPGDRLVRVRLDGLLLGLLICYDVEFPELVRAHALAGCELIAVPTALMQPQDFAAELLVPARAAENGCFVAYVNRCGSENGLEYCGLSCVSAPDGRDLVRAGRDEQLLTADIDPGAYAEWRALVPYLADRRPELYP